MSGADVVKHLMEWLLAGPLPTDHDHESSPPRFERAGGGEMPGGAISPLARKSHPEGTGHSGQPEVSGGEDLEDGLGDDPSCCRKPR